MAVEPLIVSSLTETSVALRARFSEWGYLYLPRAVSAPICTQLLSEILRELKPHVSCGSDGLPALTGQPFFETDAIWDEVYPRVQSLQAFHNFFHQASVLNLMRILAGPEVFVYPMKMARIATPGKIGLETPPHQDAHSHHAGPTMAGIWIALHEVRAGMGRLQLLPKSHLGGVRRVLDAPGVGGVQCEIFGSEDVWHAGDMCVGDVVLFHSAMVHRAEPNSCDATCRISVDTRFCDHGAPVFVTNVEPHHGWRIEGLDWESIYARWPDTEGQYYWREYPGLYSEYGRYWPVSA